MAITSGADIQALQNLATKFSSEWAGQLETLTAQIDSAVQASVDIWVGTDAGQFRDSIWPQHRAALKAALDALQQAGQTASANAQAQEATSSALN